LFLFFAKINF